MPPLYQCMTKATIASGDQLKYGSNWLLSRRAQLRVFPDRLECGDWRIGNEEIRHATLLSIRQNLIIPGYVLKVETAEKTYHFGLNYGAFWKGELPFPVERTKGRLSYSPFSILVRLVALGALAHLLWQHFTK